MKIQVSEAIPVIGEDEVVGFEVNEIEYKIGDIISPKLCELDNGNVDVVFELYCSDDKRKVTIDGDFEIIDFDFELTEYNDEIETLHVFVK